MTDSVIFACDESGAKGYADVDETFPGEVGVFAGVLIPSDRRQQALSAFQSIYDNYKPATSKLHITELTPEVQRMVREEVYEQIRALDLPCFWYAIHVAGFHSWHITEKALLAPPPLEPGTAQRFKRGSPREAPASMHVALFEGLYGHLVAFLEERKCKKVAIEIWTDQVDSPIVQNFESAAKRLLFDDPIISKATAFDTLTEKIVTGRISVEVKLPPELQIELTIDSLTIVTAATEGVVLAADILANSLNHHFKSRTAQDLYTPLNRPEAILGHPLERNLDAFNDWGSGDLLGDHLWRHPKTPQSA